MKTSKIIRRAAGAAVLVAAGLAGTASAQALKADISSLGFLVGSWNGVSGRTVTGHAPRGSFRIEPAAGGAALLRRDHSVLLNAAGKQASTLEQVMLIYPENGQLRADYFDGAHVIHYTRADVDPGHSVRFIAPAASGPGYSLTLRLVGPRRLAVRFEALKAGANPEVIAEGEATRS